jgi:hypothetical protein
MEPQVGHDLPQEYQSSFGEIAEYRADVWRLLNREYWLDTRREESEYPLWSATDERSRSRAWAST